MGIVLHQIALIALITQPPEFAHVVAVIEEELREGLDAPKRVTGGRERSIVVAVQEDHRDVLDAANIGAKANHRLAEIEVFDPREVVGNRRADRAALAWRRAARQSSGAKLQQNRNDRRNAKMARGHRPLPSVSIRRTQRARRFFALRTAAPILPTHSKWCKPKRHPVEHTPIQRIFSRQDDRSEFLRRKQLNSSKMRRFLLALAGIIVASTGVASAQIVALGHSAVRGHVAENEMWPAVLESMLRARGSQVRVINAR